MKAIFITGTDTGVGKTVISGLLARFLSDKGYRVITQKWIQTGSRKFPQDIDTHLELMKKRRDDIKSYLSCVAPYVFGFGSSPHLAAELEKRRIKRARIIRSFTFLSKKFDFIIIEGVGGILVPFDRKNIVIDIAKKLNLPLVIVAKNRLGAINHTLLAVEAAKIRGMKILGIVFNGQPKKENAVILKDNPRIIKALTGEKILGNLPWLKDHDLLYKMFVPTARKIYNQLMKKA